MATMASFTYAPPLCDLLITDAASLLTLVELLAFCCTVLLSSSSLK
jgi:hypothetical protein